MLYNIMVHGGRMRKNDDRTRPPRPLPLAVLYSVRTFFASIRRDSVWSKEQCDGRDYDDDDDHDGIGCAQRNGRG